MQRAVLCVVPIRSFRDSKTRLSERLDAAGRAALMRSLASGVVEALSEFDVVVVTDDHEVADWARGRGVDVVRPARAGLEAAAECGRSLALQAGFSRIAVVHADLAAPISLAAVVNASDSSDVVVVADRHGDGTNVLIVPAAAEFEFAYGPGSFGRHVDEADRLDLSVRSITDSDLGWDVDTPADLDHGGVLRAPPRGGPVAPK